MANPCGFPSDWVGRTCTTCGEPVADGVVPAEKIDGSLELECFRCWQDRLEERNTLLARTLDGTLTK